MNNTQHTDLNRISMAALPRGVNAVALLPAVCGILFSMNALAGDFQRNALFNPSQFQLQAETNGRVMIYDQMENTIVEAALDQQFNRIEHMMFVRTRHVNPDGSVKQDEDCD